MMHDPDLVRVCARVGERLALWRIRRRFYKTVFPLFLITYFKSNDLLRAWWEPHFRIWNQEGAPQRHVQARQLTSKHLVFPTSFEGQLHQRTSRPRLCPVPHLGSGRGPGLDPGPASGLGPRPGPQLGLGCEHGSDLGVCPGSNPDPDLEPGRGTLAPDFWMIYRFIAFAVNLTEWLLRVIRPSALVGAPVTFMSSSHWVWLCWAFNLSDNWLFWFWLYSLCKSWWCLETSQNLFVVSWKLFLWRDINFIVTWQHFYCDVSRVLLGRNHTFMMMWQKFYCDVTTDQTSGFLTVILLVLSLVLFFVLGETQIKLVLPFQPVWYQLLS